MKLQRTLVAATCAALVLCFALAVPAQAGKHDWMGRKAKYVFLFIGDGMGMPQRAAAEQYTGKKLVIDSFANQGMTSTMAADRFITGSAASATAMASGTKTNIGMIGMTPDQRPVKTLAEMARDRGMKVGVVSSVSIDHATPAAFYAHVPSRSMYHEIDHALAASGFDYFGGGGIKDPEGKKSKTPRGDAMAAIKNAGYTVVTDRDAFLSLRPGQKVFAYNEWLQDSKALPYHMDNRSRDINLAEFTKKGIELLDNPDGFFMMVEGGKIDWACHANDAVASIHDTLVFDEAVRAAYEFATLHPNDTLIVVSGDHECGGLTLGFAGTKYETDFKVLKGQKVSFTKFDQEVLVPFKNKADASTTFADIKPAISDYFGLKFGGDASDPLVLNDHEVAMIQEAFARSMAGESEKSKDPQTYLLYGGYEPLSVTLTHVLNRKAGLSWTSYKHTGVPVATSAYGVGAPMFRGYFDNTDVALKIMAVMGIDSTVHYAEQDDALSVASK